MTTRTALSEKMHALADTGHARAAAIGFYSEPQTVTVQSFMGAFARARRFWCDITGEPLI